VIKTLAAIWYEHDQNEPSRPFILRLDVPNDSMEAVAQGLLLQVRDDFKEENGEFYDSESADKFRITEQPHWGEWEITNGDRTLIATSDNFVHST